jgi:hypothetical protein
MRRGGHWQERRPRRDRPNGPAGSIVITISPAAALATDATAWPPFLASASVALGTRSNAVTWWPAPTRLAAIGAPILPSPINPIVAIPISSWKKQ